jgi:hypothetical protein
MIKMVARLLLSVSPSTSISEGMFDGLLSHEVAAIRSALLELSSCQEKARKSSRGMTPVKLAGLRLRTLLPRKAEPPRGN